MALHFLGLKFGRPKAGQLASAPPAGSESRNLANPEDWLAGAFGGAPVLSGIGVTPATAMRCTPVRAAVEAICEAVGSLPLIVYERGEDNARDRAHDHPSYGLLHDLANDWTPAGRLIEQVTRDALLWGNGYAHIGRDGQGVPRELIRLKPSIVTVDLDAGTAEPRYKLSTSTGQRTISRNDILHIAAPSVDGISGQSPVTACREAIALNMALEAHAAKLFGRGARPSGLLKFPNKLGDESAKRIKLSWQAAHAGEGAGGTAVLEEGGEFQPLTFNSVDSQFLQIWERSTLEICRVFRVPPHIVFELGRATWGNASEMGEAFLRFTLTRWLKVWQGEVRLKLIGRDDRDRYYAEFLVDDLLRSDLAARADAYGKLIASRVLNPNEARAMENRAPYAGGERFENPNTTTGAADA